MENLRARVLVREVMSRPVRRVLYRPQAVVVIHLRGPLLARSSDLPENSGEQPSNVLCLTLLQVGFT